VKPKLVLHESFRDFSGSGRSNLLRLPRFFGASCQNFTLRRRLRRIRIEANEHMADDAGEGGGYQKPEHGKSGSWLD
jgi:hypothetical protein